MQSDRTVRINALHILNSKYNFSVKNSMNDPYEKSEKMGTPKELNLKKVTIKSDLSIDKQNSYIEITKKNSPDDKFNWNI